MTRLNLSFSDLEKFIKSLKITCAGGRAKRYQMIISPDLVVVKPGVSTPELNTLIFTALDETTEEIIRGIATNLEMAVMEPDVIKDGEGKDLIPSAR